MHLNGSAILTSLLAHLHDELGFTKIAIERNGACQVDKYETPLACI